MNKLFPSIWGRVPPKYQRGVIITLVIVGLFAALYIFVSKSPKKAPVQTKKQSRNIFGQGKNQIGLGIAEVNAKLAEKEKENKDILARLAKLEGKDKPNGATPQDIKTQVQLEFNKLKQDQFFKEKPNHNNETHKPESGIDRSRKGKGLEQSSKKSEHASKKPNSQFTTLHSSEAKEIRVISASSGKEGTEFKNKKKNKDIETFLPSGSIFSGTLITGVDMSCGKHSRKDPFPVLLRIKKEAILPNFFRADVRECFLIAAGYGDLGSERAYLRGERISCIRQDGKALESKVEMWAVGEDGKAGVRGRLVSKTGALLARAMMAGFLQGFGQIFMKQPVLTIATQPQQNTPFQSNLSKDAMQSAGLQGAGTAMELLAKYYIDMAKEIFPVIEIDAGRKINFVMTIGKSLKLQASKAKDS